MVLAINNLCGFGNKTGGRKTIEYVGGQNEGYVGSADPTITINFALTNGNGETTPKAGDLVIMACALANNTDYGFSDPGPGGSGYTRLIELYQNDSNDINFAVYYKYLTANESSVVVPFTNDTNSGGCFYITVWRNVDNIQIFDVTSTTAQSGNSALVNPPSIDPLTPGAVVVVTGASGQGSFDGTSHTNTSSFLTDFRADSGQDLTNSASIGGGYVLWTGGTVDPPEWGNASSSTSDSWAGVCIALRPGV